MHALQEASDSPFSQNAYTQKLKDTACPACHNATLKHEVAPSARQEKEGPLWQQRRLTGSISAPLSVTHLGST